MTTQFPSFEIDTSQAIKQLELLGYQRGDAVYVRAFLPKVDPRYASGTARKADNLDFKQILQWQQQGYGVYFVINGGGHKDENVQLCRAVFIEHDDLEIELQRDLWQTLLLPEPTFQVQTRKSVHSYWVFEKPISVEDWKQLQTDLLTYTNADPAIKNPSRVMRLAGAWHIKPGENPLRCDIISQSGLKYTYETLRDSVPVLQHPESVQEKRSAVRSAESSSADAERTFTRSLSHFEPTAHEQQYTRYEDISVPVPVAVPLEVCLCKESRALLNFGVNEGGRNTNGAKLARDLIGTANHFTSIGQQFDGDPQQLLQDYADRCTPPLPTKEVESIWKSAEKDHPGPSCTPEGVETCIKAWYWNTHVKPNQNSSASSANPGFDNVSSVDKKQPVSDNTQREPHKSNANAGLKQTLRERILEILSRHDSESMRAIALMDLANLVKLPYRQIEQLVKLLTDEVDFDFDTLVATQKLSSLLKTCPYQLDLTRLLEPQFARLLIDTANAMPTAPEFLFTTLLATAASQIGSAARIVVKPSGNYTQPMVMWTSIVADSGSVKTPAQRVIIDPLVELETSAFERYQVEAAEYRKLQAACKGKKQDDSSSESLKVPIRQRYVTKDSTLETLQRIHGENPRGILYYRDEVVGLFKTRNQYRGGLGADEEQELDQFNGSAIIYDRSEKSVCLPKSAISRTGSIQWEVLAAIMGDHNDYNGSFARWLFCAAKSPKRYLRLVGENSAPHTGISQALRQLYIKLALVTEKDYFLSTDAAMLFEVWQHSLVDAQVAEESYGIRIVYPKIEAYTARLALWLHIVNAVLAGETPTQVISGNTMQKAIELAAYFLWQHKLIHTQNSPESGLTSWGLKIQKLAEQVGGATASMLKSGIRALRKKTTFEIRRLMEMMAAAGWGRVEGQGSNTVYMANGVPPKVIDKIDTKLTLVSVLETPTKTTFENKIDICETSVAADVVKEKVTNHDLNSSLDLENVESCQFVNSNAEMPTVSSADSIDIPRQSECQLSIDESLNIETPGVSEDDNAPHLVESADVPTLPLSDLEAGEAFQCQDSMATNYTDELSGDEALKAFQCQGQEFSETVADVMIAKRVKSEAQIANSISSEVTEKTQQDVNATSTSSNEHNHNLQPIEVLTSQPESITDNALEDNRKLQPIEVLTLAGERIGGYFIDACMRIANLTEKTQQFTFFDADGVMYVFEGQIRKAPSS
ncbi:hypothetical protein NIES4075_71390 [Tolypothrix sp. NIES-4075]|uniref:DUF3987 domain-containing protein n=1 Tax=Tolypothrix sp. NIES-4075 TaxID=2005459 RepID=UPI000B5CF54F|nr:DUF3987 domain-containing protein [Tolypothrix sp. NIES-4075]GAX46118.1 hypothetical protein NIES4075_71390 [Tolypothrix sp. NIES-4075]